MNFVDGTWSVCCWNEFRNFNTQAEAMENALRWVRARFHPALISWSEPERASAKPRCLPYAVVATNGTVVFLNRSQTKMAGG